MDAADEMLLRLLAAEHMACPVCGYDLHRLTVPRCSECGKALALKVVLEEQPVRGAWIGALAAACVNAGLGMVAWLVLAVMGSGGTRDILLPRGLVFDVAYFVQPGLVFLPLMVLLMRRRFLRWPLWVQVGLTVAIAAWGVLVFYGMGSHLR